MAFVAKEFISFLKNSPTAWHHVAEAEKLLLSQGFIRLEETAVWKLEKEKKYFVTRQGSIAIFALPLSPVKCHVLGAHTDSPALKLKPHALSFSQGFLQLSTEVYGGPLLNAWLNKDLAIAGKVAVLTHSDELKEELVFLSDTPCIIPQLAIHLDKDINDKGLILDKQNHLKPIIGVYNTSSFPPSLTFESILKTKISFKKLLSHNLFLIPIEEPAAVGLDQSLLAAYRLDNISSSYACLQAMLHYQMSPTLPLCFLWDAEEIGSASTEGASSSFASDIFGRIRSFYQLDEEHYQSFKAKSLAFSVDVAHSYHPNHPHKFDPDHLVLPGNGIVIKHNASKRYMTDTLAEVEVIKTCQTEGICYQHYAHRSDLACGSTIGPIFAAHMGIQTVDLGICLLSMHSSREIISLKDQASLHQLLNAVINS